jgi:hypothetical protein
MSNLATTPATSPSSMAPTILASFSLARMGPCVSGEGA